MVGVMQINIAGANDRLSPIQDRLKNVAHVAFANEVDVLTCQAVTGAVGHDAPLALLRSHLPDHRYVAQAGGIAILSRLPLGEHRALPLSSLGLPDDPNARVLLVAGLQDLNMALAVGHFSWIDEQAVRNVEEVITALRDDGDVLLAGDFNQQPDSRALATLQDAGFVDSWARLHPDDQGLTYEVGKPWGRIDYILERADRVLVNDIRVVGLDPVEAMSDHAALIARVDR